MSNSSDRTSDSDLTLECILRPLLLCRVKLNPLEEFDDFVFKCYSMLKIQTRIKIY